MGLFKNIKKRVSDEISEREADSQSDRMAKSSARLAARGEREKQFKETAIQREKMRGENARKRIKAGGFVGQFGQAANRLAQAESSRGQTRRLSTVVKGKRKGKGKGRRQAKTRTITRTVERREPPREPDFPRFI